MPRYTTSRRTQLAIVVAMVLGLIAAGISIAAGAGISQAVACTYGSGTLTCPIPEQTVTVRTTVRTTVTAPPSTTTSSTPASTTTAQPALLDLPRVPWEGGPAYWAQFPKAKAAGWADPTFFPIALWYGSAGVQEQVAFDKAHGINTYAQNNPGNPWNLLHDNNMFSLYAAAGAPADDTQHVGELLDDEVDGRYSDADGIAHLKSLAAQYTPPASGRFAYVNYTSGIVTFDRTIASSSGYLNGSFNEVIGLDQYFYSNPQCDTLSLRWRTPATGSTIDRANCRTASSYGKMIELQREIAPTKPIWAFVEVISPGGGGNDYHQPTGDQITGAAWNSIIHGARGIDWFSQSPDGGSANTCPSGDALRDARTGAGACSAVAANVEAMGRANAQIRSLATVINSQGYQWSFGPGLDTALKVQGSSAYILAMTLDGGSGSRTFTLPAGITGSTVTVVGEGRTLPVASGKFTDTFAAESTHHIYQIAL